MSWNVSLAREAAKQLKAIPRIAASVSSTIFAPWPKIHSEVW
jgi:hypothetical protein